FYALLTFKETSDTTSGSFSASLQASMRSFVASGGINATHSRSFNSQASSRNLKIYINAVGIDPEMMQGMLATDMESFKAAILKAAEAIKGDDVGRVVGMEISPWSEHLGFQNAMGLPSTTEVPPWLAKVYEEVNGDFISQVGRVRKFTLSNYYTARNCLQALEEGSWTTKGDWRTSTKFVNLLKYEVDSEMTGGKLEGFLKVLTAEPPKPQNSNSTPATSSTNTTPTPELYEPIKDDEGNMNLMVKHSKIVKNARRCFEKLAGETGYIGVRPYYDITECTEIVQELFIMPHPVLSKYCMPT
ncbi:MAG: hypothetical protein HQK51_13500, partial [Oligoflexia bacterium]|nr:hypothetical protein [Oligoflexia bacterium]